MKPTEEEWMNEVQAALAPTCGCAPEHWEEPTGKPVISGGARYLGGRIECRNHPRTFGPALDRDPGGG